MPDSVSTASAPSPIDSRLRALDETAFVLNFLDRSDRARARYVVRWDEVLSNYLVNPFNDSDMPFLRARPGLPVGGPTGGRYRQESILKDPETHQIVESIASQGLALLLGQRDYITATPFGADDYEKSRLVARLLMGVFAQPGVYRTHYQLIKDAFLFGTAILEVGWETRSRWQMVPTGYDLVPGEVVYRDGPLQRVVDIYDFYPDPSGTRIQEDMVGVAKRFTLTMQEALRLGEAGVYDIDDVRDAIGRALAPPETGAGHSRAATQYVRKRFPGAITDLPDQFATLDGFEYWGESPVRSPDRVQNRVITLLNGVRVRSRANPFLDGNIPFKEIVVNPIAGRFYGLSPAEVVRFLQDSTDALLMAFTDLVTRAVKGPIFVGQAWGGNPQDLIDLPSIINCTDVKQVANMPIEINVLQFCAAEITRRKLTMREGTGATNTLQAIGTGDRATATEVSELVRLASQRIEPMIQLIEREDYPWIGRTLHSRLRQFLPAGGAVSVLGGESFAVPLEAINVDTDIRFTGARLGGSRFQRLAQYRESGNILGSPVGQQLLLTFPEILVRWFRDGLDIPDAEQIVVAAQQRTLAMMQMRMVAQGGNPGEAGGPGGPGGAAGAGPAPPARSPAGGAPETFGTGPGQTQREGQRVA